jgi:IS5 family transposase
MLRIHLMQQCYALSDPAREESLCEIASMRRFARLSLARGSIPDETTILNFRHLLKKHSLAERILETVNKLLVRKGLMLQQGTIVDASRFCRNCSAYAARYSPAGTRIHCFFLGDHGHRS